MANLIDAINDAWDLVIKNNPTTKIRGAVLNTELSRLTTWLKTRVDATNGSVWLLTYLDDPGNYTELSSPDTANDKLQIWDESAGVWKYILVTDLTGSSGVDPNTFDAKGDLLAGTADNTYSKLTVGANDTFLIADSVEATGLKWGNAATVKTALAIKGLDLNNADTVQSLSISTGVATQACGSGILATLTLNEAGVTWDVTGLANGGVAQCLITVSGGSRDIDDISDTGSDITSFYPIPSFGYGDMTWADGERVLATVQRFGTIGVYSFITLGSTES